MRRVVLIPLVLALFAVAAGYAWVAWTQAGPGAGVYARAWSPEPVHAYWDPQRFYAPVATVTGVFTPDQCIACHAALTPGIVADWRASRHAQATEPVACPACHGTDHQALHLPTPAVCGGCHGQQHAAFLDERRYGFPSHALALARAYDAPHYADKPPAETVACVQCHSVSVKCDSCHTRHRFSAAEARRPEACTTCHSGPPHPDDQTYFASAHGRRYLADGAGWDWSKPLVKGNYPAPTCAYCHMTGGRHQVADKSMWKFGLYEVNPNTAGNRVLRTRWLDLCSDCHPRDRAAQALAGLDAERQRSWQTLKAGEAGLRQLRAADRIDPPPRLRPAYPMALADAWWPRARIGFYEGQASAFYNVSPLERDYFELWYFASLGAYKGAAHGADAFAAERHAEMTARAGALTDAVVAHLAAPPTAAADANAARTRALWTEGAYTGRPRRTP